MCEDKESMSAGEKLILDIFKDFYWPNQTPCNQIRAVSHKYPGANKNPTNFNIALNSLLKRGCIRKLDDNITYCLTDCGIQAIGAIPPNQSVTC